MAVTTTKIPVNIALMPNTRDIVRNLTPVTSPSYYDGATTTFHDKGLFSTEIFGRAADTRRSRTMSYIDIKTKVLHPIMYRNIEKVAGFYIGILSGTQHATWDPTLRQFVKANEVDGDTGYAFFMRHFKDIEFTRNDSTRRDARLDVLDKYRETGLYDFILVIPAGLRDAEEGRGGNLTVDEINEYYRSIISLSSNIDTKDQENPFNNSTKLLIQRNFNAIFQLLFSYLKGKGGLYQGNYFKRKLENGTRSVLAAGEFEIEDMDGPQALGINDAVIGLLQSLKGNLPLVVNRFLTSDLLQRAFSGDGTATVVDRKTLLPINVPVRPKERDYFLTEAGINTLINRFTKRRFRQQPVVVGGNYLAMTYLDTDKGEFRIIGDTSSVPPAYMDKLRPTTYAELFYYLACPAIDGTGVWVTRYPNAGEGSTSPNVLYLKTTTDGYPVKELGSDWLPLDLPGGKIIYREWPSNQENFVDTIAVHPNKLARKQGDHDGDLGSADFTLSDNARKETQDYVNNPDNIIRDGDILDLFSTDTAKWTLAFMTNPGDDTPLHD